MSSLLARLFPIVSLFDIPTVGVDFSDATVRFMQLKKGKHGLLPALYGEAAIPAACMQDGRITDELVLGTFLKTLRKKHGLRYVRVSIPQSLVYTRTLSIDIAAKDAIRPAIKAVLAENIPLKADEALFEYQILSTTETTTEVHVVAMAEAVSQEYLRVCTYAGLIPVSFEVEGQAIARAALPPHNSRPCISVHVGAARTGISIVVQGIAVHTASIDIGGTTCVEVLTQELGISVAEAERLMHEYGLTATEEHKDIFGFLAASMTILKEEIYQCIVQWHQSNTPYSTPARIDTVYIGGEYSTIAGLADYLGAGLRMPVVQVNPWNNCFSFENVIPPISHDVAQKYTTAIGLALTEYLYD